MNVQTIISVVRNQTNVSSQNISDSQILDYINMTYQDLISLVANINENYFYETFFTDTIAWQNEYLFPLKDSLQALKKIISISVKYNPNDEFYTKVCENNFGNLPNDVSFYEQNQSISRPFYIIADNGFFLYPIPSKTITDGIKIEWILNLDELSLESSWLNIFIPREYHYIIITWVKIYIFNALWKIAEKNDALQDYEMQKTKMLESFTDRSVSPIQGDMPDLSSLS